MPSSRLQVRFPTEDASDVDEVSIAYRRPPPLGRIKHGPHVSTFGLTTYVKVIRWEKLSAGLQSDVAHRHIVASRC